MIPIWLQVVLLLGIGIALLLKWLTPKPLPGIPHNGNLGPLGDIPEMGRYLSKYKSNLHFFESMQIKHGAMWQLLAGPSTLVVVFDPCACYEIYANLTPKVFDRDEDLMIVFGSITPNGMLNQPTNAMLRAHRRALAPAVSSKYLDPFSDNMARGAYHLVELWRAKYKRFKGEMFSIKEDLYMAMSDSNAKTVFGKDFGNVSTLEEYVKRADVTFSMNEHGAYDDLKPPDLPDLFKLVDYTQDILGSMMISPWPKNLLKAYYTRLPRWKHAKKTIWAFLQSRVDEARAAAAARGPQEGNRAESVLDMMMDREAAGELGLNEDEIKDEAYTLMEGGSETSAASLMWGFKILARHPEVQKKLHAHLVEKLAPLSERLPTFQDVTTENAPYLEAVTWELVRCTTAAAGGPRMAMQDTTILGAHIPKGTRVLPFFSAFTREDYPEAKDAKDSTRPFGRWTDADSSVFNPDRWLDADGQFNPRAGPMLRFGAGPRGCFGKAMALLQIKMYVAIAILTFTFEAVPEELDSKLGSLAVINWPQHAYVKLKER